MDVIRFAKTPDTEFKELVTEYANMNSHVHYREIDPQEKPEVARQYNVTKMNDVVVSSGTHNETLTGTTEQDLTNGIAEGHARHREDDLFPRGPWRAGHRLDRTGWVRRRGRHAEERRVPDEDREPGVGGGESPRIAAFWWWLVPSRRCFRRKRRWSTSILTTAARRCCCSIRKLIPSSATCCKSWNISSGQQRGDRCQRRGTHVRHRARRCRWWWITAPARSRDNFNGTMTFFPLARTVSIADKSKAAPLDETELLKTSERSFTVPNLKTKEVHLRSRDGQCRAAYAGRFRRAQGRRGGRTPGQAKDARLVVIGNSSFATNQWAGLQRNGDLFLNTVQLAGAG